MCAHRGKNRIPHRAVALLVALIAVLAVLLPTFQARAENTLAGDVEFRFNGRNHWVGQTFTAEVDIINAGDFTNPIVSRSTA